MGSYLSKATQPPATEIPPETTVIMIAPAETIPPAEPTFSAEETAAEPTPPTKLKIPPLLTDTGRVPKHVKSTYRSTYSTKDLEAYVEVLQVAHGHWNDEPATLVTLAFVHVDPSSVQSSTATLTIASIPQEGEHGLLCELERLEEESIDLSTYVPPPAASVLLHAPSFLRRPVSREGKHGWLTLGVFAPPVWFRKHQQLVVSLKDPLLVGLPYRVVVRLVVANCGRPFVIAGEINLKSAEKQSEDGWYYESDDDDGFCAVIDPAVGPRAALCTVCKRKEAVGDDAEPAHCDGLDPAHIPLEVWERLAERDAPKWPDRELLAGDGAWVNCRSQMS